jgi:cysteinyl-tRNA synthetase
MPLRVYNDLTRRKEEFVPLEPGKVKFYNCGPTVYSRFHIGNARNLMVFDTIVNYLRYRGYDVTYVQNFTDIDDKMIKRANEEGITVHELAEREIANFKEDAALLGIKGPDVAPRAMDHIPEIIEMIQDLIDKGYAYPSNGDVYYRVRKNPNYGCLSHRHLDDMQAGASERADFSERKEDPFDFVLWKGQKPGEPAWESPWGPGRPGWHIECSAMARKYLGDTLDFHSGGEDLIFPHHEDEIAQSEPVTGKIFSRYWLHNAFLNIDGVKMSKSAGNFRNARDVAEAYGPEVVRFYILSAHYRTPLNFSGELLESARNGLSRLHNAAEALLHLSKHGAEGEATAEEKATLERLTTTYRQRFIDAMDDDFNTGDAIAVLFDLARDLNTAFATSQGRLPTRAASRTALDLFKELAGVLGLLTKVGEGQDLDAEVQALVDARQAARKAKNFAEADRLRDQLSAMGIILEDTPQGVRWKRK